MSQPRRDCTDEGLDEIPEEVMRIGVVDPVRLNAVEPVTVAVVVKEGGAGGEVDEAAAHCDGGPSEPVAPSES